RASRRCDCGQRDHDGRVLHRCAGRSRRLARGPWPWRLPYERLQSERLPGTDRRRTSRRRTSRLGRVTIVDELLERSRRLGSDRRNTNYAGGNTSAKGTEVDPVTGQPIDLLWVKGSGGDLGTHTAAGLAVLRLDRLRALVDVYPGEAREDEMVEAFDFCRHGLG